MEVLGEVYDSIEHTLLLHLSFTRRGWCCTIAGQNLVQSFLIAQLELLLDLAIFHDNESPVLYIPTARRTHTGGNDFTDEFVRHRIRFEPAHRSHSVHRGK